GPARRAARAAPRTPTAALGGPARERATRRSPPPSTRRRTRRRRAACPASPPSPCCTPASSTAGALRPSCSGMAGRTTAFAVRARFAGANGAREKANTQALVASAVALGGKAAGGRGPVRFKPPLAGGVCAPFAEIKVPVDRSRMELLRAATAGARAADRDQLALQCLPAP